MNSSAKLLKFHLHFEKCVFSLNFLKTYTLTFEWKKGGGSASFLCHCKQLIWIANSLENSDYWGLKDSHNAMWQWGLALHSGMCSAKIPLWVHSLPTPSSNNPSTQKKKKKNCLGPEGTAQPKITGRISTFICIPEQAQTLQQQLLGRSQAQIRRWKTPRSYCWLPKPPPLSDTSTDRHG